MAPVVLITGCSAGGIGFALAEEFATRGCKVYASARSPKKMDSFNPALGIVPLAMDVNDDESVTTAVQSVISSAGRIDFLVNNAGVACYGPTLEVPLAQVENVFQTNVVSFLRVTRAVIPHMAAQKSGTIVCIGSIMGEIPTPWAGVYAASKAAMMSLSTVLEMECTPLNVKVMTVAPGGVRSNIASNASSLYTELSPSSPWYDYREKIISRMGTSQASGSLNTTQFAKIVATKALSQPPPSHFTLGSFSTIWWILQFLPRAFVYGSLWKRLGALPQRRS